MRARWYWRRLRRMSLAEIAARMAAAGRQWRWSHPARRPDGLATLLPGTRAAALALPRAAASESPSSPAAMAVVAAADQLMRGEWSLFGRTVAVADEPDWFHDPLTGRDAPRTAFCFRVPHRDEAAVGNVKFVWELSRHQAATLLACAWWLTGRDAYAERAALHLRSWWRDNPFLQGVHWVSGIEVGLRLLSWTWMRALLSDWPGCPALFEDNDAFARQLYHHCRYLQAFRSAGSSANNHLIAELAGLATAAAAFPWFRESAGWARDAGRRLVEQAEAQTGADGWNREQASGYHLFVAEMLTAAALAARMAGCGLPLEGVLRRMADALAASLDATGRPPRFGDGDDGRGVLLDAPGEDAERDMAAALLDAAAVLAGPAPWWPARSGSVLGAVAAALCDPAPTRDVPRPALFPGCGMAILRSGPGLREIWARCDSGPHGFGALAAHGHADALSVELRHGGVDVLADPGTYCYHGEPAWRALFRGTAGHNTLTLAGRDQAVPGGPFLWLTQPRSELAGADGQAWQASHDGYRGVRHHRRVTLMGRAVAIHDWIDAAVARPVMLAFHLGPAVTVSLQGRRAVLAWPGGSAAAGLPGALRWQVHRGETEPPFGWHSAGFGQREPASVLAGRGTLTPGAVLESRFTFAQA